LGKASIDCCYKINDYDENGGKLSSMKVSTIGSWNGIEKRRRDRRGEEVKKCFNCGVYIPLKACIPLCPDCVKKVILIHKKGNYIDIYI